MNVLGYFRRSYTSKKGEVVERHGTFIEHGKLLYLIVPDSEARVGKGQQITFKFTLAADGNMRAVWRDQSDIS